MPPVRSVEIIINAGSGLGDKSQVKRQVEDLLTAAGVKAQISLARSGAQVVEFAQRAARGNSPVIVAGGGDGTISAVAAALLDSDKTLGVLPLGTLNHFAQDLKIPLDLVAAVRTVIAGHTTRVDVGEVNGRTFVNNSSLGLYPTIVRERLKQQRLGYRKWPAFVWAALTVLRRYPFVDVRLRVDEKDFSSRTPFVFVGNNQYVMEGLKIGARERLDAGVLSLHITPRFSRLRLVRLALRALIGRLRNDKDFVAMLTETATIETRRKHHKRMRVALDGEVGVLESPLHYRIRRAALSVIVPRPESKPEHE
jgi:YegS/Rv2252/BmrU family lipid kinase